MTIDFTKPIRTKDGKPVQIISTYGIGDYPIIGYRDDDEHLTTWTLEGRILKSEQSEHDIENVPEKKAEYINIYPNGIGVNIYESRSKADASANPHRTGCIRVEYEEGQWDE